ncbi:MULTISPECIES: TRAP transporter substrate-binding protein [unclassified Beijerinckia]|uniref:TRAP transporter substrate-binding protein n=1 Tax=unclassified Beijerinckia TaxID=2638183 RepID=UPI00147C9747|nr:MULTISPECIES: TRAP transporter substrate-binding protein [unclassified Beijerinckia]
MAALALPLLMMGVVQAQAQIKLKISSATVNDPSQEWAKAFTAGVDARSGGKIKIEFYPAGQLGGIPSTVEGTALGTIEMVTVASGFFVGLEPRFSVFDAPGLFEDFDFNARLFADPAIRERLSSFGKDKGVESIAFVTVTPLYVLSHKPIRTIADLAGQKIRTPGGAPLHLEPLRKAGASPLSMPLGEVLSAMQNKAIDGVIAGLSAFTTFKFFDVAKALTAVPSTVIIAPVLVNSAFLKSLGPDLEKIVREEAAKAALAIVPSVKSEIGNGLEVWKKNGGEVIELSAAEQKKYLDIVANVVPQVSAATPGFKEDYDAIVAAGNRLRAQ